MSFLGLGSKRVIVLYHSKVRYLPTLGTLGILGGSSNPKVRTCLSIDPFLGTV